MIARAPQLHRIGPLLLLAYALLLLPTAASAAETTATVLWLPAQELLGAFWAEAAAVSRPEADRVDAYPAILRLLRRV